MPLPTGPVIGIMMDNLEKRKSVFPISGRQAVKWADSLGIPAGGETVLYTGSMYQLLPYMIAAVNVMGMMENSFLGRFVGLGRFFNRIVNVSSIMFMPKPSDQKRFARTIRDIARLLLQAGVQFGYLYKDDLYAGALAFDMGADRVFAAHARKVYAVLKSHGVRTLITIDPHTTNMLRSVYPTVIDGFDIEVKSYLEVLAATDTLRPLRQVENDITIHDSCVYARYENVIEEPRQLLQRAGFGVREPEDCRKLTFCCGGPVESLFPSKAHEIGKKRVEQLKNAEGKGVATMCPICLATLQQAAHGDLMIDDISRFLVEAFCEPEEKGIRARTAGKRGAP
ncbi:(Fe-S)-binding protein [Candidatus Fermentibacteria bacterium]|nr:(Fe-S)-binding protein [Candidatus Fermentibacteria bacterium]